MTRDKKIQKDEEKNIFSMLVLHIYEDVIILEMFNVWKLKHNFYLTEKLIKCTYKHVVSMWPKVKRKSV